MTSPVSGVLQAENSDRRDAVSLNASIKSFFSAGGFFDLSRRVVARNPRLLPFLVRTIRWQREAARRRLHWEAQGVHVPLFAIFSVTGRCNLHCRGCYHRALRDPYRRELSVDRLKGVVAEAKELGISVIVLAGGEPLVRKEILDITREFREIIFLLFTNGVLLDQETVGKLRRQRNVVPVISVEGHEEDTDWRRGPGVHKRAMGAMTRLERAGVLFGTSVTMTRANYLAVTDYSFVENMMDLGSRLFFFVEFTPVQPGTGAMVLSDKQRANMALRTNMFRRRFSSVFVSIPGDEKNTGCLSAGRGFIHISSEGNLEPCPFVPYSDANVGTSSLKEALQSRFLKAVRENHGSLREDNGGGCALIRSEDWMKSLLYGNDAEAATERKGGKENGAFDFTVDREPVGVD